MNFKTATFDDFCATLSLDQVTWMLRNPESFADLADIASQPGRPFF